MNHMSEKAGVNMAKYERQELYAVYLNTHEWLKVMECLFKDEKYIGLAEYIGDELGTMIAIHPRNFESHNSCNNCMHRDECIIRCTPPICRQYLNVKVVEK